MTILYFDLQAKGAKKLEEEVAPWFLTYMDNMLRDNGGNFFVGDKVSADMTYL